METVEACRLVPRLLKGAGEDVWNLDMFGRQNLGFARGVEGTGEGGGGAVLR